MAPRILTALTCWLVCLGASQAQTAQLTLNAWAHGLGGAYDEVNLTGTGLSTMVDGASTSGGDTSFDIYGQAGSRSHSTASAGFVSATTLGMRSFSQANANVDPGFGGYGTGSLTTQGRVSAIVPFRVDDPALTGQAGVMRVPLHISGGLSMSAGVSSIAGSASSGEAEVLFDVSGQLVHPVAGCPAGFDLCNRLVDIGLGTTASGAPIAGTILVDFPFIFGQWASYSMQLQTRATASAFAFANSSALDRADIGFGADASFEHTIRWGGIEAVSDAQGQAVTGWSVVSLPGLDLAAVVPEPGQVAMLVCGLLVVANRARRAATRS